MHHTIRILTAILAIPAASSLAGASGGIASVRGLEGEPEGGFRQSWFTARGWVPLAGVRQSGTDRRIAWRSAPVPEDLAAPQVALVWYGAMGLAPGGAGNFTISVGGRPAADFDVALRPTRFPGRGEGFAPRRHRDRPAHAWRVGH